jgi:hypothetical protein
MSRTELIGVSIEVEGGCNATRHHNPEDLD